MPYPSTFSIVAYDPEAEAWGVAVASKFPAVGAVVPWAAAGAGAVATQSYANPTYGPDGLDLMRAGRSAEATMEALLSKDPGREKRQVGLVDAQGRPATFTGDECHQWAGGRIGENFAAQGNILTGPEVVEALASTFLSTGGGLPERLLQALLAADRAGGDRRGRQSSAIFVAKAEAGYGGLSDRWLDYRVDDHEDPVPRLIELVELHRLYFGESPEEEKLPIEGEVARTLMEMMRSLGYYQGSLKEQLDAESRRALAAFVGNENFEERTDLEAGTIDEPVFHYLRKKHLP